MTGRSVNFGNQENIIGNGKGGLGGAVDAVTGSVNVQRTDDPRFDDIPNINLVNETNLSVADHYYPDSNGVSQLGEKSLAFEGHVVSGTAGETLKLTIEGTNGYQWNTVVGPFINNVGVSPVVSPVVNVTNTAADFSISWDHFPYQKWRVYIEVTGTTSSNSARVASYQKAI